MARVTHHLSFVAEALAIRSESNGFSDWILSGIHAASLSDFHERVRTSYVHSLSEFE